MDVLLSVRPEWLQKILAGQKTVELRLSRPDLMPPFKVFLYCSGKGTKNPHKTLEIHSSGKIYRRTVWWPENSPVQLSTAW